MIHRWTELHGTTSKIWTGSSKQIHPTVLDNQGEPTGDRWLVEMDGCLHLYHHDDDLFLGQRLNRRLIAEQGWFESIVKHAPSVGTFYEDALRAPVSDILPATLKAGTGFIFDPETRRHSRQLDILVYDDSRGAPIYRRGDFVVVTPQLAISLSEVKKNLRLADIRALVGTTVNSYFGQYKSDPPNCQRLSVFSYSSSSKVRKILDGVAEALSDHIRRFESKTESGFRAHLIMYNIVFTTVLLP
jgi:Domain of unknown function (DUF6602)